jgi:limonene-1,2-epoxide hydrolase
VTASEADAAEVLARFVRGQQEMDLDLVVSCWHDDVEVEHPLRPDRSWKGADTFRTVTARIWSQNPERHWRLVASAIDGNTIFLETVTEHADGSVTPLMGIMEVEDGKIRRGRMYTDRPTRDGFSMVDWVRDLNPE